MTERNDKCEDTSILLGEMVLGTISGNDKRKVEKHLLGCSACRDELKDMRSFYNLIGDYRLPQPDPAFSKRMKAAVFREMQNEKQPGRERLEERLPWYRRPRLVLALTTVAAVGLTAIVYVAISPYLAGLGSEPELGEDSVAGGGVATLTETRLPYTSRDEKAMSPPLESEEPALKYMEKDSGEGFATGYTPASPAESAKKTMGSRGVPDKYTYWESTLAGSGPADSASETVARTSAVKRDTQTSTDFDKEYLKAMYRKAESSGEGYADKSPAAPGRWGSWSHPDVGVETAGMGGASDEEYVSFDDDIYSTLLELTPEERERVLEELEGETDAIK
ncbi:MAG: zf-HC2 domain-containing protein [bacterium]|nr:zf-HC2 domain-containing protein [bacterium]